MAEVSSDIIDMIVEWIGRKKTKSQIKQEIKKLCPGLTPRNIEPLITLARRKIAQLYNIDPLEYRGSSISFYESVIRSDASLRYKILCQQRLDALFGLEHISTDSPAGYAEKVLAAMKEADGSVTGEAIDQEDIKEKHVDIFAELRLEDLEPELQAVAAKVSE